MTKASHPNQSVENPEQEAKSDTRKSDGSPDDRTQAQAEPAAETQDNIAVDTADSSNQEEISPESGASDEADSTEQDPLVELEDLRQQLSEAQDSYLRAKAEVDNIRKRADVEVANARKFALEGFVREILSVRDSLEMAQATDQHSDGEKSSADISEGLALILKQLDMVFERFQVELVEAVRGDKLDPDRHQAMSIEQTDDLPPNSISQVVQKGYLLNNRLLRPAMVIVAKTPEKSSENT